MSTSRPVTRASLRRRDASWTAPRPADIITSGRAGVSRQPRRRVPPAPRFPRAEGKAVRMNTPVADVPRPARRRPLRALLVVAALLAGSGVAVVAARWLWPGRAASVSDGGLQAVYDTPFANARPGVRYVGDEACAACHVEIAASYREHPMGRSLGPVAPSGPREPAPPAPFDKLGFHFSVEWQDGRMIHKAARLDAEGRSVVEDVADVRYALGSGRRGRSYLIERDGRLFQSPVSWFTQAPAWDLSPGFASIYPGERVVEPSCLFCHANRV